MTFQKSSDITKFYVAGCVFIVRCLHQLLSGAFSHDHYCVPSMFESLLQRINYIK